MADLTPTHLALIDALARQAAVDYLAEESTCAAANQPAPERRSNPVPLRGVDQAA